MAISAGRARGVVLADGGWDSAEAPVRGAFVRHCMRRHPITIIEVLCQFPDVNRVCACDGDSSTDAW